MNESNTIKYVSCRHQSLQLKNFHKLINIYIKYQIPLLVFLLLIQLDGVSAANSFFAFCIFLYNVCTMYKKMRVILKHLRLLVSEFYHSETTYTYVAYSTQMNMCAIPQKIRTSTCRRAEWVKKIIMIISICNYIY